MLGLCRTQSTKTTFLVHDDDAFFQLFTFEPQLAYWLILTFRGGGTTFWLKAIRRAHLTITTDLFTLIIMFMRNHVTRHSFIWVIITYFAKFLRTIKRDDSVWNGGNSIPNLSNFPEQCKKNEVFCKISPSPDILRHTVVFSNITWPLNCHRNGAIKGL